MNPIIEHSVKKVSKRGSVTLRKTEIASGFARHFSRMSKRFGPLGFTSWDRLRKLPRRSRAVARLIVAAAFRPRTGGNAYYHTGCTIYCYGGSCRHNPNISDNEDQSTLIRFRDVV